MDDFQLCRICISDSREGIMVSIFGQENLSGKIKSFANVQIDENDGLPKMICINCARNTLNVCSFQRKCEESDSFLRNQLILHKVNNNPVNKNELVVKISSDESSDEEMKEENEESKKHKTQSLDKSNCKKNQKQNENISVTANSGTLPISPRDSNIQFSSLVTVDEYNSPLIPEIELITPNEEEKITDDQIQGYQCSICYEIFSMRATLNHHIKLIHPESNPSYECFNCRKSYLSKRFLEKHIRRGRCVKKRKNQTRPMECSNCNTLFPTGHHLGWHKRTGCPYNTSVEQQIKKFNLLNMQNNLTYRENVLRKIKFNKPKQKGRNRIKLNAATINLAKVLIAQDATTSKMAQELNISRTFAWRLRKNLLNGVNLQERLASPDHNVTEEESKPIYKIESDSGEENTNNEESNTNDVIGHTNQTQSLDSGSENSDDDLDVQIDENLHGPQPSCSNLLLDSEEVKIKNFETKEDYFPPRKPRKQSVFIDENIYEQAKVLVAKNTSTLDISRILNVSQMSAWKLRDSITKGLPFTRKSNSFQKNNQDKESLINSPLLHPVFGSAQLEISPKENRGRPKKIGDRDERDKKVTDAILALINEDNGIQYWKITEKLAEQGFTISTSSVCQKLKSLGIHRRSKTANK